MATLQYTVWGAAREVGLGPILNENVVTIGGSSTPSGVVDSSATGNSLTRRVRIMCDVDAWVTWGLDPTALPDGTSGRMMGSENPEYFDMSATFKIAVIERV